MTRSPLPRETVRKGKSGGSQRQVKHVAAADADLQFRVRWQPARRENARHHSSPNGCAEIRLEKPPRLTPGLESRDDEGCSRTLLGFLGPRGQKNFRNEP